MNDRRQVLQGREEDEMGRDIKFRAEDKTNQMFKNQRFTRARGNHEKSINRYILMLRMHKTQRGGVNAQH
ncbi:hypothetical protein [Desulfosporosinus sp. Sb-LF]|uniref:hypothetical protein n=1 Tax=Desulfosporosinus sp. Sb-LF TaxID=2560027 RepID=UPI00107F3E7B|nr:hypothetical protein [Desulfosporosinus sp. Sb-LF]